MATGLQRLVRRAVLAKLKADTGLIAIVPAARIYPQAVPVEPGWPFLKMGPSQTLPRRAACLNGGDVTMDVHAFARGSASETAEDHASRIGAAIETALRDNNLALEGGGNARIRLSDIRLLQDDEPDAFHWLAQINARVLAATVPVVPAPFTPASLSPTAWYDPSDLATVWEDSGRTIPASVNGVVGALDDKSGNGRHLVQATTAAKPMLRQSAALYYLEFDGVDDAMASTATVNLAVFSTLGFSLAFTPVAIASFVFQHGNAAGSTGLYVQQFAGASNNIRYSTFTDNNDLIDTSAGTFGAVAMVTTVQSWDISQAAVANKTAFRINGASPAKVVAADLGAAGTVFGNNTLYVGYTPTFGSNAQVNFSGLIILGGGFTAPQLANVETWHGTKVGLTL